MENIFYSQLAKVVGDAPARMSNLAGDQWSAWLVGNAARLGVKQAEIEWSGINDWLAVQPGKVSKAQLSAYLDGNGVQVGEVIFGSADDSVVALNRLFAGSGYEAIAEEGTNDDIILYQDQDGDDVEFADLPLGLQAIVNEESRRVSGTTRYEKYQLPGGESYREVLLTLPPKEVPHKLVARPVGNGNYFEVFNETTQENEGTFESENEAKEAADKGNVALAGTPAKIGFQSAHWDQPNVLAHVRVNDRIDVDGTKVLFVEELQSDWSAKGRKDGFDPAKKSAPVLVINDLGGRWEVYNDSHQRTAQDEDGNDAIFDNRNDAVAMREQLLKDPYEMANGAPAAPFIKKTDAWLSLAIKRVIKMAVDGGYDRVAFINGEQSAERYDLSKQIRKIEYEPTDDGLFEVVAFGLDGKKVISENEVSIDRVEALVGKDIAAKIKAGEGEKMSSAGGYRNWSVLSGIDLKVGGEGMTAFYDTIVPSVVKDVIKKLGGGKLEDVGIGRVVQGVLMSDRPYMMQPGFTITDKMREIVTGVGVPLFQDSRGVFDSSTLTVTLLEAADESTFIHESGHFYLEVLGDLAAGPGAPPAIRKDMEDVLEWLGVPGGVEGWQQLSMNEKRPFHEQFARGVEAYFLAGVAPVPQLEGMFSRFAKFLANVYKSVAGLDVELTPKITSVFDRLVCGSSVVDRADVDAIGAGLEAQLSVVDRFPVDVNRAYAGMVANFYGAVAGAAGMSASDLAAKYPLQIRSDVHGLVPGGIGKTATDSVEFKKWFGASKVVGDDGLPLKVFHGTGNSFSKFKSYRDGLVFFSTEPEFAEEYGEEHASGIAYEDGEEAIGNSIMPVYLHASNPWDYQNSAHVSAVIKKLEVPSNSNWLFDREAVENLKDGDWIAIEEYPGVLDAIRTLGHDAVWMTEGSESTRNIAVFSASQIKSVFNRGTWDRADPEILHQSACVASMSYFSCKPQAVSRIVKEGAFSGAVLNVSSNGVVTQKINRDGDTVRHDFYALSKPVVVGSVVDIKYVGGVGVVGGQAVAVGMGR